MKLPIEIISQKNPIDLLLLLAREKFSAEDISHIVGGETINIDSGMNDVRAKIEDKVIMFYCRYEKDSDKYENNILDFCREHCLTLRFNSSKKNTTCR
tara:strand:- start:4622 stop:4915 length:294 start_codon:yes stop_codon:yes gene_type:complete